MGLDLKREGRVEGGALGSRSGAWSQLDLAPLYAHPLLGNEGLENKGAGVV